MQRLLSDLAFGELFNLNESTLMKVDMPVPHEYSDHAKMSTCIYIADGKPAYIYNNNVVFSPSVKFTIR